LEPAFRAAGPEPTQEGESIVSKITTIDTPLGALGITSDGEALTAITFSEEIEDLRGNQVAASEDPILAATEAQLRAYFAGELKSFDLPLSMSGTAFQRRVWEALRAIPYGETASYGKVAATIGLASRYSSRAVGLANGANPIPIVVPCHRVIGANGSLTGYGGGLERKQYLLTLELTHA
jgi:methylated-DNA-[protein]-cysteine S-methyltransferase